jgi:hypothetical protein
MKFEQHPLFSEYMTQNHMSLGYEYKSGLRKTDKDFVHRLNVADKLSNTDRVKYLRHRKKATDLFEQISDDLMALDK